MESLKKYVTNFLILLFIGVIYVFSLILILSIAGYIIVQAWLFFSVHVLATTTYNEWLLAGQAYLTFVLFGLLLVSSIDFDKKTVQKIKFSPYYVRCFSKPENAVSFWLNFRFYLALILSFILLGYSVKSVLNLCAIDGSILISILEYDPYVYMGAYLEDIKRILSVNSGVMVLLCVLSVVLHYIARKSRGLAFIQALLLVLVSGCLILVNLLDYLQLTILSFVSAFLMTSCLACVMCLISQYLQPNLRATLQLVKNYLVKTPLNINKEQYLRSYLLFLTCTNLLYWSMLFNYSLQHPDSFKSNLLFLLFTGLWAYLALRFLRFAACYDTLEEKIKIVPIPLAPALAFSLYISPLLAIFALSWSATKKQEVLYSLSTVLFNPTLGLQPIDSLSSQSVIIISSPSEKSSWFDVATTIIPIARPAYDWVTGVKYEADVMTEQQKLKELNDPINEVIEVAPNSEVAQELEKSSQYLDKTVSTILSVEKRAECVQESSTHVARAARLVQREYPNCCPGSPGSNRPGFEQFKNCFLNYAAKKRAETAEQALEQSKVSSVESIVDKLI